MQSSSRVKIAYLIKDLGIGGVQKVLLDICSGIDTTKYEVLIYCLDTPDELASQYQLDPSIRIKKFSYTDNGDYSLKGYARVMLNTGLMKKNAAALLDDIRKEKPAILHTHVHPRILPLGRLIREEIRCKLIATQHFTFFKTERSGRWLARLLRPTYHAYHLLAVSGAVGEELIQNKMQGSGKLFRVIDNKINLRQFIPAYRMNSDPVKVIYIARIGPPKAHKELIEAWALLNDHPVRKKLLLVGPDGLQGEIQKLAKEMVKDDPVEFLGSRYDIPAILKECDFAVFPSFKEGLPIALLEKMAAGLPVISSDIPELMMVVKDGKNGLTFRCGDVHDLSEKIASLLENEGLRLHLGREARKTIEQAYGSDNRARPNEEVYEAVLKMK
jgi:glycosyltransferase involved in cell wall biosynthesis